MVFFFAQDGDLETSDALLNYAIDICSDNHLTYYLARAAAQLAKNAQAKNKSKAEVLELIQDALAFAKINKNKKLIDELNHMKKMILLINEGKNTYFCYANFEKIHQR